MLLTVPILPPDALPLRLVPAIPVRNAGGVDVVAEIVVQIEQRARMARVEDGGQVSADREGVHEHLAKLVVDDHTLLGLPALRHVPVLILRKVHTDFVVIDRDDDYI